MKNLFIILYCLISFFATAQLPQALRGKANVSATDNNLKVLSRFTPPHDTLPDAPLYSIATIDTVVYIKGLFYWVAVSGGGSGSSENFNSILNNQGSTPMALSHTVDWGGFDWTQLNIGNYLVVAGDVDHAN